MIANEKEAGILLCYQQENIHLGTIARRFKVHRDVVLRVVKKANLPRRTGPARARRIDELVLDLDGLLVLYPAISAARLYEYMKERGYVGSSSHFRHVLAAHRLKRRLSSTEDTITKRRREWLDWLYLVERRQLPTLAGADNEVRQALLLRLASSKGFDRQKALVLLAHQQHFSVATISRCLAISSNTVRDYLMKFRDGGLERVYQRHRRSLKRNDEELKKAVFALLHEPPSLSNINRTSWKMEDLQRVLADRGYGACRGIIRQIIKDAGYKWRNARIVLTSNDPKYREKVDDLRTVLSSLRSDQRFFSIDEFGPFAIKINGGRLLVPPGVIPTVPQWQKTKGSLIVTAALELSSNQVTHFYSDAKNTAEMIKMTEILIDQYQDAKTLYLSWDAASWHISKALKEFIAQHNAIVDDAQLPRIELLPLPAGAQFLNIVESLFSGMARAIIHNSNYGVGAGSNMLSFSRFQNADGFASALA